MPRILIVEDDDALREFLYSALNRGGYQALAVADGATALAALSTAASVELLVVDVHMPGLDGLEVARRALDLRPDLRVLFVTGFAGEVLDAKDLIARDARILAKPFYLTDLVTQVNRLLVH